MTLKDLEFKAEDFKNVTLGHYGATPTIEQTAANIANHILKEKLEKAPEIYCRIEGSRWRYHDSGYLPDDTHTARLVCIEERKEK